MQLSNHVNYLLHYCIQLIRRLVGEFSYTLGAIYLASEWLMISTKVASSSIKVAFGKKSSKHIHMRSSFEELVTRNPTVKQIIIRTRGLKVIAF